jgi:CRISPR-associated endoribonuclease Cas6
MRLQVRVSTAASEIPWPAVLAPGRAVAYGLLNSVAPGLGRQLHETGWGPHGMVPFGYGAPSFPSARRQPGRYAAGGSGLLEFGSPLPEVVEAWARALGTCEMLDWGGVAFGLRGTTVSEPPDFPSGVARFRTATPVVLNGSRKSADGVRPAKARWLLPGEEGYLDCLGRNLNRKAQTLGFTSIVEVHGVTWVGAKRSFTVGGGAKPGAPVEVELSAEPDVLKALWSWGLGQSNAAGFGWIAA